jgi:hypothetical protein
VFLLIVFSRHADVVQILWREVPMGTTRNVLGIYRIIYAIQLLAQYSRDHFWPWYLWAVLGISKAGDADKPGDANMTGDADTTTE